MHALLKSVLVLLSLGACAGISYGVYQYSERLSETEEVAKTKKPQAVEATQIVRKKIADRIELVGTLEPNAEANLRPRTSGYITKLAFDVGDYVEAGQIVVELERSHAVEAYQQADAALRVSKKELEASEARLKQLKNMFLQYEKLKDQGTITALEFEEIEAQRNVAQANKDLQDALVDQAASNLKSAELMRDECRIATSISGYVAERLAEVGDLAAPIDVLMRIVDLKSVYTVVHVVEKDYDKIREAQIAKVEVDAYPGKVFEGKVERIAPYIDIETRTAAVKIQIKNAEGYLKPGMYARVSLLCEVKSDAPVIPMATILEEEGESYVYIADQETSIVRKQVIQTGVIDGEQVEVKQGISDEDWIITLGNRLVKEGDQVNVKRVEKPNFPDEPYLLPQTVEILGAE